MRALLILGGLLAGALEAQQSGIIKTFAGGYPLGDGGPAIRAALAGPRALAVDRAGNLHILDHNDGRIRRVTPQGTISTLASGLNFGWASQHGMAFDSAGNLYVNEHWRQRIRKITPGGNMSVYAGNGEWKYAGDGGPATAASFNGVGGLAMDASDQLYVADYNNHRVRLIDRRGVITTVAGNGTPGFSGDGGPATEAQFANPGCLAIDGDGNLYVADVNNSRVRKLTPGGVITTVAGGGTRRIEDGAPAVEVSLGRPTGGLATDAWGNLYINSGTYVYMVSPDGLIFRVAGNGRTGHTGDGGPATEASLRGGEGIAVDAEGNLYRADHYGRVRRITRGGIIDTVVGVDALLGNNGSAVYAKLSSPNSVAVDPAGNVYTVVYGLLRKITPAGKISVFGGSLDGCTTPSAGESLPATSVCLGETSMTVDASGNLYLFSSQSGSDRIYKVTPDGLASLFPGTESGAFNTQWGFRASGRMAVDSDGSLYVSDPEGHRVWKITAEGVIQTIAGTGERGFTGDGGSALKAQLNYPNGVAIDAAGNLYIADTDNRRVRRVGRDGIISTFAGDGSPGPTADAVQARSTSVGSPQHLAFDASGNLFLSFGCRVGKISPSGILTKVAGTDLCVLSGDGGPATLAGLSGSGSIAVDGNRNLYLVDTETHRIRRVEGSVPFVAEPAGLVFSLALGAAPAQQGLTLSLPDPESRPFVILPETSGKLNWLSVSPATGSVSGTAGYGVTVTANPAGLPKGGYQGRLVILNPNTNDRISVPVSMTVSGTAQQLRLSQTGLTFAAVASGQAPPAQSFRVLNLGVGRMNWTVATSTLSGGAGWLKAEPARGASDAGALPPAVEVKADPAGLAAGSYFGLVTVAAAGVDNSPQSLVVMLVVYPADQPPAPVIEPLGLIFTGTAGGAAPATQEIRITNILSQPLDWNASVSFPDGMYWFWPVPDRGSLAPGASERLRILPQGLKAFKAGVYRGEMVVSLYRENYFHRVQVGMVLIVSPAAGAGSSGMRAAEAPCQPKRLVAVFQAPGEGFRVTAGWPTPLQVKLADDCGRSVNTGRVITYFSTNDPPVPLTPVGEGQWTGSWAPRTRRDWGVDIVARAETVAPRLVGEVKIMGGVKEDAEQPLIASGGVLNAASFRSRAPLAVGSYISIFGSRLGGEPTLATRLPLPTELGGTLATIAGRALPLHFSSENQLNAVLPYGIPEGTTHQLIVRRGARYSLPEPVLVASGEPAVFTVAGGGAGQAHAYAANQEGVWLADERRPARPGEVLVLYATGLGPVTPSVREGEPAPSAPAARTLDPVTLTIQGVEAKVGFAGLAPGMAGIYQVNAEVPRGLVTDLSAPIVLRVAGQAATQVVTLAVAGEEEEP